MRAVWAIAVKDLRVLSRHPAALFWVLGFPMLQALLFGAIFGGGEPGANAMPVAVVDLDGSPYSRALAERLGRLEALRVRPASYDSARALVRRGRLAAYVALMPGLGGTLGFGGADSTGGIELGVDPSRRAEAGVLEGLVTQAVFQAMQGEFGAGGSGREVVRRGLEGIERDSTAAPADRARRAEVLRDLERLMTSLERARDVPGGAPGADSAGGTPAADGAGFSGPAIRRVAVAAAREGPRSGWEVTFPSAMLWALIAVCSTFAVSIVAERRQGTYLRLRLTPVSREQVLAGKGLACFLAGTGVLGALLAVGVALFRVRVGDAAMLAAAVLCTTLCFVGVMMFVATLGREERSVSGASWALLLIQSMLGGGMIPLIAMPPWLQAASHLSVVRWGILSIEGAVWRGFGWAEAAPSLAILLGVGLAGFAIGSASLRRGE